MPRRSIIDHSMDVGSTHFRRPARSYDNPWKKRNAVDPRTGELTAASKLGKGMNYAKPVSSDGKPTRYFQFMIEIVANPGITRKEIVSNIYGKRVGEGYTGYMNSYCTILSADGFTRTTTKGEIYPTKKLVDYVKDFIEDVDFFEYDESGSAEKLYKRMTQKHNGDTSSLFESILADIK